MDLRKPGGHPSGRRDSFFIIVIFHVLATINHWYWRVPWIDIPAHLVGGFWISMVFFHFISPHLKISPGQNSFNRFLIIILLAISFVALFGVLWEFYEFVYDFFVSKNVYFGSRALFIEKRIDVIKDLFFDLIGGLVLALLTTKKSKSLTETNLG